MKYSGQLGRRSCPLSAHSDRGKIPSRAVEE